MDAEDDGMIVLLLNTFQERPLLTIPPETGLVMQDFFVINDVSQRAEVYNLIGNVQNCTEVWLIFLPIECNRVVDCNLALEPIK